MWLIAGLGNPGPGYENTRHNCGFMVIDELAGRVGKTVRNYECRSLTARTAIGNSEILLAKPQTFMNLSGVSVAALIKKYEITDTSNVLVIIDDLALPFGKIRIRPNGSSGGHNGLKSIIEKLNTLEFPRIRLGIRPDHPIEDSSDFVLGRFPRKDSELLKEMITTAADAVDEILKTDITTAMSKFN